MKSIEDKIKAINFVTDKYSELRKEFSSNQDIVVGLLKGLIDKYADEFSLTTENSVRKIKFYNLVYRVKEKESFSEKLIRNNDYNLFDDKLDNLTDVNEPELKNRIKDIDDLIGIKVLTDLNIDSINMFNLISSSKFIKDASDKGISIKPEDLTGQPVKMKNGLNIFKMRCKYETWNFELQIKSKLESAWGDMEHSIFYKDYKITPVRDLAQQSMNHIGKLLIQIDEFLQEIREANSNFIVNSQVILFLNEFEKIYAKKVADILSGINYNFKKIASLSYNINNVGNNLLHNKDINTNHLTLECIKYSHYINNRNKDFDLQIFEIIVLSSIKTEVSLDNIESSLDDLFEIVIKSYIVMILENKLVQDEQLAEKYTRLFFNVCIKYNCKEFILNTKNVYNHINNLKLLEEIIEVLGLEDDNIIEILCVYSIFCFEGDINSFIREIDKDQLLENLEKSKIEIEKVNVVENDISDKLNSLINNILA